MAHPKRRQSSTRRDKRRTHDKAVVPQIAKDVTTGEFHLYHREAWSLPGRRCQCIGPCGRRPPKG